MDVNEITLDSLTQEKVWEVLQKVGKLYHYLAHKSFNEWDGYDLSNYKSIVGKASLLTN